MVPGNRSALRLFRLAGIDVFLHWSWFVVALWEVQRPMGDYRSPVWAALEYVSLFVIVTLHEFGHAMACRQTGGTVNQIVLWPLGGVAYVNPPQRPGATLWSIAAGPIVNLVLMPILIGLTLLSQFLGLGATDASHLLRALTLINGGLLIFNILPIYPLDGGQILRSLLWFGLGRTRSLLVATIVGFLGVTGLVVLAIRFTSPWIGLITVFVALNCWNGLQRARLLLRIAKLPRRQGFACPLCRSSPPIGLLWTCNQCQTRFDTFETNATCPRCRARFAVTACVDCGRLKPIGEWLAAAAAP